jgi:hypothetical protein
MTKTDAMAYVGRIVMEHVRDHTIHQFEGLLEGRMKAPADQEFQNRIAKLSPECREVLYEVGKFLIDDAVNNFLWVLEGGEGLELVLKEPSGDYVNVTQLSDGLSVDMHDWVRRFSKYQPTA